MTDWDRNVTFCLSLATILLTGGIGLAYAFWHVCRVADAAPSNADGPGPVLVLGARLNRGEVSAEFAMRLSRALRIRRNRTLVLLGGRPHGERESEAAVGRRWLMQRGTPTDAITVEEGSCHTLENLREARSLLGSGGAAGVVLVTSRYHLARCSIFATALGLRHSLCGAEDRFSVAPVLTRVALEAFFIHWFFVGRLWARIISSTRMLDRVR